MEQVITKVFTPSKGICNSVPDVICEDGELQECMGLTFRDEALRPIQNAKKIDLHINGDLLFVHELNSGTKLYIYKSNNKLYAKKEDGSNVNFNNNETTSFELNASSIVSIGNTLIANSETGLHYFLWKGTYYKYLGDSIPKPEFEFALTEDGYNWNASNNKFEEFAKLPVLAAKGILDYVNDDTRLYYYDSQDASNPWKEIKLIDAKRRFIGYADDNTDKSKTDVDNLFSALYGQCKSKAHENNAFINPFAAVIALRLYDGSYTRITNPIILFSNTKGAFTTFMKDDNQYGVAMSHYLMYKQLTDYTEWKDIISEVCVFVTTEVDTLNTKTAQTTSLHNGDSKRSIARNYVLNGRWHNDYDTNFAYFYDIVNSNGRSTFESHHVEQLTPGGGTDHTAYECEPYPKRNSKDVLDELATQSTFYWLLDIGLKPVTELTSTKNTIKDNVLSTITAQERLQNIDYYGNCKLYPNKLRTFNRRLNLIDTKRSFFEGFTSFSAYTANASRNGKYKYAVKLIINTSQGDKELVSKFESYNIFYPNMFFFYPDSRAKHVTIYSGSNSTPIVDKDLKMHPGLNGAYCVGEDMPTGTESPSIYDIPDTIVETIPSPEELQNYIIQSETDNPFVFNVSGYVRVGQGRIIDIAGLTTALNQDAYKVATTLVFTTQGIWALGNDNSGQYTTVTPPFSREVCSNPDSITMVDNGVFFVSKKGLMFASDKGAQCVSKQLEGKGRYKTKEIDNNPISFVDFLQTCKIAYDYRDSLIELLPPPVTDVRCIYSWIYNIKTATFSRKLETSYKNIINDYPDTILQWDTQLYSMLNKPNINVDTDSYYVEFVTRPIKFADMLHMKSLRQMLHIHDIADAFTFTIEASNDCKHWAKLSSLIGRGYKFYRFKFYSDNVKANDAYIATALTYNITENNKIR